MEKFLKLRGAGGAIKSMRMEAGKTQEQMAGILGWSQESLSKCENDRHDLSADDIIVFAKGIGLPLGDVVLRCFKELGRGADGHPNGVLVRTFLNLMDGAGAER